MRRRRGTLAGPAFDSVGELLRQARQQLREAGIPDAELEAERLLCYGFKFDPALLHANPQAIPPATLVRALAGYIERRLEREPLPYITGMAHFYGREFQVDRRVLIPRPETELLVERAIRYAANLASRRAAAERTSTRRTRHAIGARGPCSTTENVPHPASARYERDAVEPALRAVDIGTGSGILAITLALELPGLDVHAVDVSRGAVDVARSNAMRHGVVQRLRFHQGNLASDLAGGFDILVANLPYIRSLDLPGLQPEIRFEPRAALDGGKDGMRFIGPLTDDLPRLLRRPAIALLEIDPPIATAAAERARSAMSVARLAAKVSVLKDLAGLERVLEITL